MYIKVRANKTCQTYFIHSVKVAQASLAATYLGTVEKKMYIKSNFSPDKYLISKFLAHFSL